MKGSDKGVVYTYVTPITVALIAILYMLEFINFCRGKSKEKYFYFVRLRIFKDYVYRNFCSKTTPSYYTPIEDENEFFPAIIPEEDKPVIKTCKQKCKESN